LGLPSSLFPSGFPTKTLHMLLLSPIRAICPAYLIFIDFITNLLKSGSFKFVTVSKDTTNVTIFNTSFHRILTPELKFFVRNRYLINGDIKIDHDRLSSLPRQLFLQPQHNSQIVKAVSIINNTQRKISSQMCVNVQKSTRIFWESNITYEYILSLTQQYIYYINLYPTNAPSPFKSASDERTKTFKCPVHSRNVEA
jgi:hypothetical protein